MDTKVKETLEKQLELLSKRSKEAVDEDLPTITRAMVEIANSLETLNYSPSGNL